MEVLIFPTLVIAAATMLCIAHEKGARLVLARAGASHGCKSSNVLRDSDDGRKNSTHQGGIYACLGEIGASLRPQRIEPMHAPSWPPYLTVHPVQMVEPSTPKVEEPEQEDGCEARQRSRETEQVYHDCLTSFDACGDHDIALTLKISLLSQYAGHQGAVRRAFKEIFS